MSNTFTLSFSKRRLLVLWLATILAAICLRPDLAGVTSLMRSLVCSMVAILASYTSFIPTPCLWPI